MFISLSGHLTHDLKDCNGDVRTDSRCANNEKDHSNDLVHCCGPSAAYSLRAISWHEDEVANRGEEERDEGGADGAGKLEHCPQVCDYDW